MKTTVRGSVFHHLFYTISNIVEGHWIVIVIICNDVVHIVDGQMKGMLVRYFDMLMRDEQRSALDGKKLF